MHYSNFDASLSSFERCPSNILVPALRAHFGASFQSYAWRDQREYQQRGVDLIVYLQNGAAVSVELKQSRQCPPDIFQVRLPLETLANVESGRSGFLLRGGMQTNYVLWVFGNGESVMIPFKSLAAVFRANLQDWKKWFTVRVNGTEGRYESYHSEFVAVPVCRVRNAIRRHLLPLGIKYRLSVA